MAKPSCSWEESLDSHSQLQLPLTDNQSFSSKLIEFEHELQKFLIESEKNCVGCQKFSIPLISHIRETHSGRLHDDQDIPIPVHMHERQAGTGKRSGNQQHQVLQVLDTTGESSGTSTTRSLRKRRTEESLKGTTPTPTQSGKKNKTSSVTLLPKPNHNPSLLGLNSVFDVQSGSVSVKCEPQENIDFSEDALYNEIDSTFDNMENIDIDLSLLKCEPSLSDLGLENQDDNVEDEESSDSEPEISSKSARAHSRAKAVTVKKPRRKLPTRLHRKKYAVKTPQTCAYCSEQFKTKTALMIHTRTHAQHRRHATHNNQCKICEQKFLNSDKLADHIMKVHKEILEKLYTCTLCDDTNTSFSKAPQLTEHFVQNHPNNLPHICGICGKRFFETSELNLHSHSHNEKDSFTCEYCLKGFKTSHYLHIHVQSHTQDRPYKCETCKKSFTISKNLENHKKIFHSSKKKPIVISRSNVIRRVRGTIVGCSICKATFASPSILSSHLRTKHGNILGQRFTCQICPAKFGMSNQLTTHIRKAHPGRKRYECTTCHRQYISQYKLSLHIRVHTGEKPYGCSHCPRWFRRLAQLNRHQVVHTGQRSYPCDIPGCDKTYKRSDALCIHKQICHSGWNKPYTCEKCGKSFAANMLLSSHLKNGHGHGRKSGGRTSTSYPCKKCTEIFETKKDLVTRRKIHNEKSSKNCEFCGKFFASMANLVAHRMVHTGEKPHMCEYCGKGFNQKNQLKSHTRIHTGDRPYTCDWTDCGKTFAHKPTLNQHKRTHTGEKPFVCETCGKTFNSPYNLAKHANIHVGDKSFVCPECGKCFLLAVQLKAHRMTKTHMEKYNYSM